MSKNIIVTGAGGFLGSYIQRVFAERGDKVIGIGRGRKPIKTDSVGNGHYIQMTLPDEHFKEIVADFRPDSIIHCAGSADVSYSVEHPLNDIHNSVDTCAFVLETIRKHSASTRFVLLSSAAVYGNPERLPVEEDDSIKPISPYGYHKYMCELLVEEYSSIYQLNTAIARIFSAYGNGLTKQVVFDICCKLTGNKADAISVFGSGNESRDFIHATDVASAVALITDAEAHGSFNVASGKQVRITELISTLLLISGIDKDIKYTHQQKRGYPLNWQANIHRLTELGFCCHTPLTFGLTQYWNWFQSRFSRSAHEFS